jgi:DNA-binding transcriptional LysR family regulator
MLNLDHLKTYELIVQTGSFSAAAARLGLSQPAVSLQMKQLEAAVKARLIERVGRQAKPTPAGLELLGHSQRVMGAVDGLLTAMATHSAEVKGRVSLGTGATACLYFLPSALHALRRHFPNVHVLVRTGNTVDFVRAVEENVLDMALVTLPVRSRSLAILELMDDEFVAVGPSRGPALPARATPAALARRDLLLFEPASNTRLLIDDWFRAGGEKPVPIMELGSVETIKGMVAAGLGCSIVPKMALPSKSPGLRAARLAPKLSRKLALIVRKDKPVNRALGQVIEAIRAQAQPKKNSWIA